MSNRDFWLTGYSGWSLYCAIISLFGITGYYADLLLARVPDWVAVGVFTLPVMIVIFVQWGELPDRLVACFHLFAASLFLAAAVGMEIGHWLGYRPEGSTFFRILAHVGWTFSWGGILRCAWRSFRKAEEGRFPSADGR